MAEATKHLPINGGTLISDFKTLFSFRNKSTVSFAYGFMFAFILFTIFLAFNPSSNSTSPSFSNIFTTPTSNSATTKTNSSDESHKSQFSSIFSYFYPNSSSLPSPTNITRSHNTTIQAPIVRDIPQNQTQNKELDDKVEALKQNQTIQPPKVSKEPSIPQNQTQNKQNQSKIEPPKSPVLANRTVSSTPKSSSNTSVNGDKGIAKKGGVNGTDLGVKVKQGNGDLVKGLLNCDMFDGEWVRDDSYPLYKPGSCSLIDEQFNCFLNGRPDGGYQKFKWKPKCCTLPRLNASNMLELLRGKRLVFVGDSLNRNMWESLLCILKSSIKDQSKVYEASGRHHFRAEASYSFVFKDYNCTVELFVSPFLVREWEMPDKGGSKKETLRLDLIGTSAERYKTADIIIFNTGHWWTHDKTSKGKDYYQEGSHVYGELNVLEAFRKALTTWARWVDANINPTRSLVFFRGYSASHFSGGQWNSGGQCDHETQPIKNATYLRQYPPKMMVLERVLKGMKTRVSYLNITSLTDYRKDGHPSIYRKQHLSARERKSPLLFQDCSHWCLPGVPDAWNEILYAELLIKQYQQKRP